MGDVEVSTTVITVNTQKMSLEEFSKFKEEISKDKSKRIKEVSPNNYTVLTLMQE